jgi:hypothetical protein
MTYLHRRENFKSRKSVCVVMMVVVMMMMMMTEFICLRIGANGGFYLLLLKELGCLILQEARVDWSAGTVSYNTLFV